MGGKPDGIDAQVFQIIQAADDARQVTDAVAVAIGKAARIDLVKDCFLPPLEVRGHGYILCKGDVIFTTIILIAYSPAYKHPFR